MGEVILLIPPIFVLDELEIRPDGGVRVGGPLLAEGIGDFEMVIHLAVGSSEPIGQGGTYLADNGGGQGLENDTDFATIGITALDGQFNVAADVVSN